MGFCVDERWYSSLVSDVQASSPENASELDALRMRLASYLESKKRRSTQNLEPGCVFELVGMSIEISDAEYNQLMRPEMQLTVGIVNSLPISVSMELMERGHPVALEAHISNMHKMKAVTEKSNREFGFLMRRVWRTLGSRGAVLHFLEKMGFRTPIQNGPDDRFTINGFGDLDCNQVEIVLVEAIKKLSEISTAAAVLQAFLSRISRIAIQAQASLERTINALSPPPLEYRPTIQPNAPALI
jgi:hypothetical protein